MMVGHARPGSAQDVSDQLYSSDPKMRVRALKELRSMGEPGAVEMDSARRAFELFTDPDYSVQEAAILALSSMGTMAVPYVEEVACMLSSPDQEVTQAAIQSLGYIGGENQAKAVEAFLDNQDLDLVVDACTSLGWMGAKSCCDKLRNKLKDKDSAVVAAAFSSLCRLGAESAMVQAALKGDVKVKVATLTVLMKNAEESTLATDLIKTVLELVGDSNCQVRIAATSLTGILGDKAASEALVLVALLSSKEVGVRACAATALGHIGEAANIEAEQLRELLKDEGEDKSSLMLSIAGVQPKVAANLRKPACAAAAAIAAMGPKAYALAPAVAAGMTSSDFEVRIASLKAVGSMGEAGADFMDDAMKLIEDPTPLVTATACLTLGSMAESSAATSAAAEKLAECLKDRLPMVRAAACQGLAKMGDEATNYLEILVKYLTDQSASVRAAACEAVVACGEMGQMYASDICRLIYDSDVNVRIKAVDSLVQMGERGAAFSEEVSSLLDDPNRAVQEAGYLALQKFGAEALSMFQRDSNRRALAQ